MDKSEEQIRADERKRQYRRIQEWAKERQKTDEAILKRYYNLLDKGVDEADAKGFVQEVFGLKTNRRINNLIRKREVVSSPGMKAFSEAVLVKRIAGMSALAEEAEEQAMAELEAIEAAEASGERWIEIEEVSEDGSRGSRVSTKKLSIAEAKRRWYERAKDDRREFFNVIRSVLPQTVVQTLVDNRSGLNQMDDASLDAELGNKMNIRWKKPDKGEGD